MPQVTISGEDCNGTPIATKTVTYAANASAAQIKAAFNDVSEQVADALQAAGCEAKATVYRNAIT